jgi:hypothetical protein
MKLRYLLPLFGVIFLLSSCSKDIYFTQEIRKNLRKHHVDLRKVQFYNSKKIVLKRDLTYEETKVARGTIKLENGHYVEEIIIPKLTPGVVEDSSRNNLQVAFEEGKNRGLSFVLNDKKKYQISAQVWSKGFGKIAYDTLVYFIEPSSDKAMLKVKKDDIYNFQKKVRKVTGKQVEK